MAFDAFLKIETIPGECTDDAHAEWIEVSSFSHGVSQKSSGSVSSGGSRSAERCDHREFSITKAFDKASPLLALACSNGEHIPTVTLELCRSGEDKQKYMEYILEDVMVTAVNPYGTAKGADELPKEDISLAYGKITWRYTETDHKTGQHCGTIEKFWDMHSNTGG